MGGTGMQAAGEETRHEEVTERPYSYELGDDDIKSNLNHEVDQMPHRGCLVPDESWAEGVEEYLESATRFEISTRHCSQSSDLRKENLPKDIVEENQFQPCWKIGIDPILSKVFVMLKVVPLDRGQIKLHDHRV